MTRPKQVFFAHSKLDVLDDSAEFPMSDKTLTMPGLWPKHYIILGNMQHFRFHPGGCFFCSAIKPFDEFTFFLPLIVNSLYQTIEALAAESAMESLTLRLVFKILQSGTSSQSTTRKIARHRARTSGSEWRCSQRRSDLASLGTYGIWSGHVQDHSHALLRACDALIRKVLRAPPRAR
jgi:hypothetical protein